MKTNARQLAGLIQDVVEENIDRGEEFTDATVRTFKQAGIPRAYEGLVIEMDGETFHIRVEKVRR